MSFNRPISSLSSSKAVDHLLRQFDELAEDEQGAFIAALIQQQSIHHIMNLVSEYARSSIEDIRSNSG